MSEGNEKKGLIIFGGLILAFLALSIAAYVISGHMGIEERFNNAVGINSGSEEEGYSGFFGFNIEGNPMLYLVISIVLIMACVALYIKFKL